MLSQEFPADAHISSGAVTEFTIPTATSQPQGIACGPDGNFWFTEGGWQQDWAHPYPVRGCVTKKGSSLKRGFTEGAERKSP